MSRRLVRAATREDADAIGAVWHSAWHDAHAALLPPRLVGARTAASFRDRAAALVPRSLVAELEGRVVGFTTLAEDEVELVFVAAEARGTGLAASLLAATERRLVRAGRRTAWLVVVTGNSRARRFYERQGWHDDGDADDLTAGPDGPVAVASRRYVKTLTRPALVDSLGLEPHPEGGWFRQTWASPQSVRLSDGRVRPTATLIHFLLPAGESSAWHRVRSDEVWLAHRGTVTLELGGTADRPVDAVRARVDTQVVVPAGTWQRTLPADHDALVSCLVSPGFDFADFELDGETKTRSGA